MKLDSQRTDFCLFYPQLSCRISTWCLCETGNLKNPFWFILPGIFLQNTFLLSALRETGKRKNWFSFILPGTFLQNTYLMSALCETGNLKHLFSLILHGTFQQNTFLMSDGWDSLYKVPRLISFPSSEIVISQLIAYSVFIICWAQPFVLVLFWLHNCADICAREAIAGFLLRTCFAF